MNFGDAPIFVRRILNPIELANTRAKLAQLEELYNTRQQESGADQELRELSMQSVKRLIYQLKEEISWTETRQPAKKA